MIALPSEKIEIRGMCSYPDCKLDAECIACGRDDAFREVRAYCVIHGEMVADQGSPEYHVSCSNCGCLEGCN